MSMFSGKCDFFDSFVAIFCDGEDEKIKERLPKLKLYVYGKDDRNHRVKSDTILDIAKYYPYLAAIHTGDKDGNSVYILSSDSFIDQEEKQFRDYHINDVMKYWRKCKRNKTEFNEEECYQKVKFWSDSEELKEIIHRVAVDGPKAEFDDIHYSMWENNRRRWMDELIRLGMDEDKAFQWCFKDWATEDNKQKRFNKTVDGY